MELARVLPVRLLEGRALRGAALGGARAALETALRRLHGVEHAGVKARRAVHFGLRHLVRLDALALHLAGGLALSHREVHTLDADRAAARVDPLHLAEFVAVVRHEGAPVHGLRAVVRRLVLMLRERRAQAAEANRICGHKEHYHEHGKLGWSFQAATVRKPL